MKRLFRTGLLFLIVCLCALSSFTASAQEVYEGLDVSVWQDEIDFQKVKDSGKQVVYIRAGEGREEDRRFRAHTQGAMDAGMKVGFYFFVTATDAAQAREQADFFASLIQGYSYDCRPAVDYEQFGEQSREQINEIALAFAQRLEEKTKVVPLFYTDYSNVENLWDDALARYPLWVADYSRTDLNSFGPWKEWAGFQYTDQGRVNGIEGAVDLDRFTDAVLLTNDSNPPKTGDALPVAAILCMLCAGAIILVCARKARAC